MVGKVTGPRGEEVLNSPAVIADKVEGHGFRVKGRKHLETIIHAGDLEKAVYLDLGRFAHSEVDIRSAGVFIQNTQKKFIQL
jgi:hypothetical protein